MRLTDIFKFKLFEGTDKADLEVVNENFQATEDAIQEHAAGGDHDGRYLKKAEVVNNNTTTAAGYALDARQANPNVAGALGAQINSLNNSLTNHKSSGDHDGRYYTEAEVNTLINRYKVKSTVVECAGVPTTNLDKGAFGWYIYGGYINGANVMSTVDNLRAQGYTILGGAVIKNSADAAWVANQANWDSILLGWNMYYNVPYSCGFFTTEYKTIRVGIVIYHY